MESNFEGVIVCESRKNAPELIFVTAVWLAMPTKILYVSACVCVQTPFINFRKW